DEHRIAFNVSHTGDEGLLALTSDGILGVDLERIRPEIDVLRLARRVFSSSEQAQFSTIHEERLRPSFFHVWTCKEAFLKAHGGGLTVPLTSFDVEVDPDRGARLLDTRLPGDERGNWQLKTIDVEEGLRAAVAWSGSEPLRQISNFRLEDSPFPSRR
ncbi:MAG TPA: 4'-phosphopantetheinyl transferase superfamily protein, partial [Planctomycetes bacterium]|nr:4'-phosphopantetheinyl transferase superfamily protein [Planctomycetota bacterium]